MLTPAERRRVREFDVRVSAGRASEHAARPPAGPRSVGLHRASPSRPTSTGRPPNGSRPSNPSEASHPPSVAPGAGPEDLSDLVLLAARLGTAGGAVHADEEFRNRLRQRLIAVASVRAVNPEPGFRPPPPTTLAGDRRRNADRRRLPRRVTVATGTLAGLVALSGVGFASSGAHPGDPLYGVKRSRESAQLTLARSPVARGALYLEFASNRLVEAATVPVDVARLDQLLDDMDTDTRLGMAALGTAAVTQHHPAPLELVDAFTLAQERRLRQLETRQIPVAVITRIVVSLDLLDAVGQRAASLAASVHCSGPFTTDHLGPLPHACRPTQTGGPGVSTVQPPPTSADWTSRPHPRHSGWTSSQFTAKPSGKGAAPSATHRPATTNPSSAAVVDDGANDPWSTAQTTQPQSDTVSPGVSEPQTTAATGSLVGSAEDPASATSDLVQHSGE